MSGVETGRGFCFCRLDAMLHIIMVVNYIVMLVNICEKLLGMLHYKCPLALRLRRGEGGKICLV